MKKPPHEPEPSGRPLLIRAHYVPRISDDRENFDILDWSDGASQAARFGVLCDNVDLDGRSLLDVGCGLGDLLAFLRGRGIQVDYTGVDIIEEMVARARRDHPGGRFVHADVFAGEAFEDKSFDVVFGSGVFNLDLDNNARFLPLALKRLGALARRNVVFNLLHRRAARQHDQCFYYDPDEVTRLLTARGWEVRLVDDYLENDFTVVCTVS